MNFVLESMAKFLLTNGHERTEIETIDIAG